MIEVSARQFPPFVACCMMNEDRAAVLSGGSMLHQAKSWLQATLTSFELFPCDVPVHCQSFVRRIRHCDVQVQAVLRPVLNDGRKSRAVPRSALGPL